MTHRFFAKPVLGIGALAIAAALFGGGLVVGQALEGDDDLPASTTDDRTMITPGFGTSPFGTGESAPASMDGAVDEDMARGAGMTIYPPFGGCAAPLDPAVGESFDLAAAGLTLRAPASGFDVTGISIRSEGECDDTGNATSGTPVIEYQWRDRDSGITVWIWQRADDEPVANVRYWNSATFTADGETFSVNAWGMAYPLASDRDEAGEAEAAAVAQDAAMPYPGSEEDPQVTEALEAVIASLAPSLPDGCFYTQTEGGWEDLAAFGVGDPRPAIPAGYSEESSSIFVFTPPAGDCPDNGAEPPTGDSFWASFIDGSNYLQVSVYRYPETERVASPVYMDIWGANWNSNGLGFSVYGGDEIGQETILAIARALDPAFSETCMIAPTEIDEGALAGLGLGVPVVPDGYTLAESRLIARTLPDGCDGGEEFSDSYEFSWTFEGEGEAQIHINVSKSDGFEGEPWGYIGEGNVEWSHDGTYGSVWAYNGNQGLGAEALEAIATSVDPGLDVSTLEEGGGPKPMPVDDMPREDDGASSGSAGAPAPDSR